MPFDAGSSMKATNLIKKKIKNSSIKNSCVMYVICEFYKSKH